MNGRYVPVPSPALEYAREDFSDGSPIYLYRYGNICTLTVNVTTKAALTAWETVATIPERYRPAAQLFFANMLGGALYVGFIMNTDGRIVPSLNIPAGTALWATVTYIALNRD